MQAFLFTRLLRALVTVFLVLSFAFVILRMSGDPAMMIMSADAPPEALAAFRRAWGLDASLWEQYGEFFRNLLQGNFGRSMRDGRPAMELVLEHIPATLAITLPAFFLKIAIGVPAGVYAALHRDTMVDRVVMGLSVVGHTIPSFVLGLVLATLLCRQLTLMQMGDSQARALGIHTGWVRLGVLAASTLLTACAISLAGPIGFLGFLAAYCARRIEPVALLRQLLFSTLFGMLFLLAADVLSRWLLQPYELPVGTLLAALGAPALIAIVLRGGFRSLLTVR